MDRRISIALLVAVTGVDLACAAGSTTTGLGGDGSADMGTSSGTDSGSSSGTAPGTSSGTTAGTSSGTTAGTSSGTTSTSGTSSGTSSGTGTSSGGTSSGTGSTSGTVVLGDAGTASCTGNESVMGGFPAAFWDASNIPAPTGPIVFKFLNRTNGKYSDSEIYWSFQAQGKTASGSIASAPFVQMPTPPPGYNGRMYFYICPTGSPSTCPGSQHATDYYDFIEYAIGTNNTGPKYWINYDTTRVDALGIKLALDLHVTNHADYYVGENCPTFAEDRAATFASYVASVPAEFKPCGQPPLAPYRIQEPGGGCGFNAGGPNADYYYSFEQQLWANNGITNPPLCPKGGPYNNTCVGPNASNLGANPSLSAAIYRHVGAEAGTWTPMGALVNGNFWQTHPESSFYGAAPADYYAQWIHSRAINGHQYAFPYDDAGGNSSDIGASGMVYMLVAIGW